jgi:hypothetical protein
MKYIERLLMCSPLGFNYDYESKTLILKLKKGDSCDMKGSITLAQLFDEDAKKVMIYSGSEIDVTYNSIGDKDDTWMGSDLDYFD